MNQEMKFWIWIGKMFYKNKVLRVIPIWKDYFNIGIPQFLMNLIMKNISYSKKLSLIIKNNPLLLLTNK